MKLGGKDCKFKGASVCNGAVTKEIGSKLVKICTDGKIKLKRKAEVAKGYPLVGRDTGEGKDCTWYGTVFCNGDLVEVCRNISVNQGHVKLYRTYTDGGSR